MSLCTTRSHLITTSRNISISTEIKGHYYSGRKVVLQMPDKLQKILRNAIIGAIRAGLGFDYDRTLVETDEKRRIFWSMDSDEIQNRRPLGGLVMFDYPCRGISGNTPEYVDARFTTPMSTFILGSPNPKSISNFSACGLNSGYITLFTPNGGLDEIEIEKYNSQNKMPAQYMQMLDNAMETEITALIKTIGPLDPPLFVRSGHTSMKVFSPTLENRNDVQLSFVGVPSDRRLMLISKILERIGPDYRNLFNIQLGGYYSVDASLKTLQKRNGGIDFGKRYDLDWIFYFGDAVFRKYIRKLKLYKEGNDFSMVHNPNTSVFAVNYWKSEVPSHKNVFWIGRESKATRALLTWFLIERANYLMQSEPGCMDQVWKYLDYIGFCSVK